jgi:hypothetical protein
LQKDGYVTFTLKNRAAPSSVIKGFRWKPRLEL